MKNWYVVHTQVGMEERVKRNLEQRIMSLRVEDRISQIFIPTEPVIEIREGRKQIVHRKCLPGYLLIEMEMDSYTWGVVRNTPGVTGFISAQEEGGRLVPVPLRREEVEALFKRKRHISPSFKVSFSVGESVCLTSGPFADFIGKVEEIDANKGKARVLISFLGRETPVEVDITELRKV